MSRSMFTRLMTVFMAVILVCSVVLMSFFYFSMRQTMTQGRIDEIKGQARELAYLASRVESDRVILSLGQSTVTERYIKWKARNIYNEFSAYSVVIDRTGKIRAYNLTNELMSDEEVAATFNKDDLSAMLYRVLSGEEVVAQTTTAAGPMFTVAVPWMQNNAVLGAVVIQTAAQTIHATYESLLWPTVLATVIACMLAALLIFFFTKQVTHPLTQMELAAQNMAKGNFSVRAPEQGSQETQSLAHSFNLMAAQLEELESSRKDFIANVSHELRSPITSIQGYMQSMLDGTINEADKAQYMQVVLDETKRLSKLINSLLNLSRMEREDVKLAWSDFDLNEMARRVLITKMNQIDEKQMEIEVDFAPDPCYVHADAEQIEQVLINLLDNALKYTPEKGHILLSTHIKGNIVTFCIQNDGCGISPEDAPHLFDRFYKADKAHTVGKGTGLGLAICKCIMEKHGQQIRLIPSQKGAAFEFTLEAGKKS